MAICSVWSYAAWSYACSAYSTAAGISRGCLTHCTETVITSGPCPTWSPIYPPNWSLNWSLSTYLITYTLTYMLTYIPTYILTYLVTIHLPDHLPIHTHPTRNTYILIHTSSNTYITPHIISIYSRTDNTYILTSTVIWCMIRLLLIDTSYLHQQHSTQTVVWCIVRLLFAVHWWACIIALQVRVHAWAHAYLICTGGGHASSRCGPLASPLAHAV